jgi:hypothetical protein
MLRDRDWPFIRVDSQGHGAVTAERGGRQQVPLADVGADFPGLGVSSRATSTWS